MEIYNLLINKDIGIDKGDLSSEYVRNEILKAQNQGAKEIRLIINSKGGDVYEGFSIYNDLKDCGLKITAYIHGFCGSISTLIASSAEYVEMSETAQYMIHNSSGGASGNAKDLEATAVALRQIDEILATNYSKKTGKTIDELKALMETTTYMSPNDAKNLGFIDAVRLPISAFGKFNIKTKMDNNFKNKIASAFKAIEEALTGKNENPVNFTEPLADGKTIIYGDGDLMVGSAVYTDESMTTPAPEGEHALLSGVFIIVDEAGIVLEIREIEDKGEDVVAKENADLKAKVADLEAKLVAETTEKEVSAKNLVEFKAKMDSDFKNLKSLITSADVKQKDDQRKNVAPNPFDVVAEKMKKQYL
jgi:ATP-dependent Clp endopeptidase proteolytic subunit ClpP